MVKDGDIIEEILTDYKPPSSKVKKKRKQQIKEIVQESKVINTLDDILNSGANSREIKKQLKEHIDGYVLKTCEELIRRNSLKVLNRFKPTDDIIEIINDATKQYLDNCNFKSYEEYFDQVDEIEQGMNELSIIEQRKRYLVLVKENLRRLGSKVEDMNLLMKIIHYTSHRYLDSRSERSFKKLRETEKYVYGVKAGKPKDQNIKVKEYINMYLSQFELSTRARNTVQRACIGRVKDLLKMSLADLLAIKNCSVRTVKEFYEKVLYPIGARFPEH